MTSLIYALLSPIIFPSFQRKVTTLHGLDNLPKSGGYVLACNHIDWLDGFYIVAIVQKYRHVPTHFLTKSNNYWWTGIAAQIPADRGAIVDSAVEKLTNGMVICNFPEGERNTTEQLSSGKTGTVRMAAESGVPVIPVGITCDAGRNMGQSIQYLLSKKRTVSLAFGEPIRYTIPKEDITSAWLDNETSRLMRAIAQLAHKAV